VWLISTPGCSRTLGAGDEPPRRLAPMGSHLSRCSPQESRTFRSNQLLNQRFAFHKTYFKNNNLLEKSFIFILSSKAINLVKNYYHHNLLSVVEE
jgi:hypothetical protein